MEPESAEQWKAKQDWKLNREAYKYARGKVQDAMRKKELGAPAIVAIAEKALAENYPTAYVNMKDLVGACLHWQHAGGHEHDRS